MTTETEYELPLPVLPELAGVTTVTLDGNSDSQKGESSHLLLFVSSSDKIQVSKV